MTSALMTTLAAICTAPEQNEEATAPSEAAARPPFSTGAAEVALMEKATLQADHHHHREHQTVSTSTKGSSTADEEDLKSCRWRRRGHGLPIHSLNHISKETENVEEMIQFYTRVMGFRKIRRPPFQFAGAWLFLPPSTSLHIIEKDPSIDLPEGPCSAIKKMGSDWKEFVKNPASLKRAGHHMAFRTEDLDGTRELLREYGIGFAENVIPITNQRQLFFFDPDGNGIEICECDVDPPPFEDEICSSDEDDREEAGKAVSETSTSHPK